jgi:hypothetical protein
MMKGFKVIAATVMVIASAAAFASPSVCPKVDDIKKSNVFDVKEDKRYSSYVVLYKFSNYDTNSKWGLFVGIPFDQATSKADARNKANSALATMTGAPVPQAILGEADAWYCMYDNKYNYYSAVVTPVSVLFEVPHPVLAGTKEKK